MVFKSYNNYRFIFTFFIIFLLTGCFPLTSNSIKKINVSDNKETVIKALGRPYSRKAFYNKDFFVYYVHDDIFELFTNLKKFPFVGFYPILRTGHEYWVIFENDRVVAFGDSVNFKNRIPTALSASGIYLEEGG